jgi:hypothetical protein
MGGVEAQARLVRSSPAFAGEGDQVKPGGGAYGEHCRATPLRRRIDAMNLRAIAFGVAIAALLLVLMFYSGMFMHGD